MAIQMRRGKFTNFIPSKLLPGEYAVVQGDDPSVRDGRSVYMAFAAGVVKRLATYEDMVENVSSALVDAIGDAAERLTERAEAINAAAEEGEAGRREAEAARAAAESARTTAEEGRAKAEGERAAADADRDTRQAKNDADQAQNNAAAMGMTYHVCPSSEYELDQVDGLHNVPTVAGKPGTMYLTPRVDGATGEDRYDQWLLVDGSWELMGETGSHIEPVTTDDVDAITSGGSVTADRYLNATGLTYWWAKARAALSSLFAAKSHTHAASAIASGTIAPARLPLATASAAGAVTVGDGLAVSGGRISVDNSAYLKKLVESGTEWAYLWKDGTDHFVRWRVLMGVCYLQAHRVNDVSSSGWKAGTLPASVRPDHSLWQPATSRQENNTAQLWVGGTEESDGGGPVWLYNNGSGDVSGIMSWPIELG